MSSVLYSLGRWAYRHRWTTVAIWVLVLIVAGAGAGTLSKGTSTSFSIPGTESTSALAQLKATFPQVSGTTGQIVVVAPDGHEVTDSDFRSAIGSSVKSLEDVDGVLSATNPFNKHVSGAISDSDHAAIITVQVKGQSSTVPQSVKDSIINASKELKNALPSGTTVQYGGELYSTVVPGVSATEALGVAIAFIVLLITLGSIVAAGLPLLMAIAGVGISIALTFALTFFGRISSTTPILAIMLGLAVGIDYSLFIITRHREQLVSGIGPEESTGRATATAGSAVVFAGLTVVIALIGLSFANIPFLTIMGLAAALAVSLAVALTLTLLPAMFGFIGEGLRPGKRRIARTQRNQREIAAGTRHEYAGFYGRWVRMATKWPLVTIGVILVGIILLAIPARSLQLALPDAGSQPKGSPSRVTYDLIEKNFGAGYNGPLIVTGSIIGSNDPVKLMDDIGDHIAKLPGVAHVTLSTPNARADTGIVQVIPEAGPASEQTTRLVQSLRDDKAYFHDKYKFDLSVTGTTAVQIDISTKLGGALLPFGIFVVGMSFILLLMVFRSIWVPIKASLGYLLSVIAAFGVTALVFEHGWGADLIHVANTGPVISFLPILLMGILFGLAMDYEVFLVSRMRESYTHGHDAHTAIRTGFIGAAPVVTAAALIMFSVFASFVPEGDVSIKPIGVSLAAGVLIDAFVIRMTLVPAVLELLGRHAWWMPKWLDRALPEFDVEGAGLEKEIALEEWESYSQIAIVAEDVHLENSQGTVYSQVSGHVYRGRIGVIEAPHRTGKSAVLQTLAGRVAPTSGKLKVNSLVLPQRAATVRRQVGVLEMEGNPSPLESLAESLAEQPAILAIDDLDQISDPQTQLDIKRILHEHWSEHPEFTLVISVVALESAQAALPDKPQDRVYYAASKEALV